MEVQAVEAVAALAALARHSDSLICARGGHSEGVHFRDKCRNCPTGYFPGEDVEERKNTHPHTQARLPI